MSKETPQYMSLTEAAERLGYASKSTLAAWAKEGRISGAIKIGAQWALPRAWVEDRVKAVPVKGWPRGKGTRKQDDNA